MKYLTVLFVLFLGALPAYPQVSCQALPADSPILSNSPDDIPATTVDILTYTGSSAKVRANHNFAFVEMSPNDQRVWFSPDAVFGTYYNRRYRADASSPWYWEHSVSQRLTTDFSGDPNSGGTMAVLYSPTPKYFDDRNGETYEFIRFVNYQPSSCNGVVGGFIYVSYSHDGLCWTAVRPMIRGDVPPYPCYSRLPSPVAVEQVTAIDTGTYILLVYVEGNITKIAPQDIRARNTAMDRTQTYVAYANYSDPWDYRSFPTLKSEISAAGVLSPVFAYDRRNPRRYAPYNYFMNLQAAWDEANGDFYLGRGYPYPYDRQSIEQSDPTFLDAPHFDTTPLPDQRQEVYITDPATGQPARVGGCLSSPYTLPNRMQVYKMHLGSLGSILNVLTGTWTLVADYGHDSGYGNNLNGTVPTTPLVAGQTSLGRDWGAVSFLRDSRGYLQRYGSTAYMFGADTFEYSKSHGRCYVTGLEGQSLLQIP